MNKYVSRYNFPESYRTKIIVVIIQIDYNNDDKRE